MRFSEEEIKRINKYLAGNYSKEDEKWMTELFCDQENENDLEKILKEQWYELKQDTNHNDQALDRILFKIHYNINTQALKTIKSSSSGSLIKWIARIAVILILPFAVYSGIHLYKGQKKQNLTWVELKAPAWTRAQFTLPDSTTGWLNSKSSIRYNGNFITDRKIFLDGEAYFDVYTDKTRPFVVEADDISVIASGTKFNVASYRDENNLEVVLEEGELLVKTRDSDKSLEVASDELIVYNKSKAGFSTEYVQTKKYVSWTEGKLVFRNDPIDVIARRLGRWYNVDVEIKGDNFDHLRLRATFTDENLEEVLYFLKRSLPINYKITEGGIKPDDTYSKKKVIMTLR